MDNIFFDIGMVIIIVSFFALLAKLLKQPLIPAYILTGLLVGPFFKIITQTDFIRTMSEIGIALLLFIVGLEMDLKKLKSVGLVAYLGGFTKSLILFIMGFIAAMLFGFVMVESLYLGLIISFSSTMIVVKLLADNRELDTLHGRIIIGILLLEDIIAILILSALSTNNGLLLATSLLKGIGLLLLALFSSKIAFPSIFKFAAKSQELLFLLSISILFLFSILAASLGFSISVGAFIGGIVLANLPYNLGIIGKISSLRDFFAIIFFVSLGMELVVGSISKLVLPLLAFIAIVILIKPFVVIFVCSFFGYKKKVSFLTGISLAQISEFSLIIASQGMLMGHISREIFTFTVVVALVTICLTAYFIKYEDKIYLKLAKYLRIFDKLSSRDNSLEYKPVDKTDVIICGHNRIGYTISRTLMRMKKNILVVDFNPEIIKGLIERKVPCVYGDIGDAEVRERLPFKKASMVVSTVPDKTDNILLIEETKKANKDAVIYVTSSQIDEALELYDAGADYVILPHLLGGEHVSILLQKSTAGINKIIENKLGHIKELKHRKSLGHEHPKHNG